MASISPECQPVGDRSIPHDLLISASFRQVCVGGGLYRVGVLHSFSLCLGRRLRMPRESNSPPTQCSFSSCSSWSGFTEGLPEDCSSPECPPSLRADLDVCHLRKSDRELRVRTQDFVDHSRMLPTVAKIVRVPRAHVLTEVSPPASRYGIRCHSRWEGR